MGRALRVVHCPVNMGSIGWTNVQFLRKRGIDARLVLFQPRRLRPYEVDIVLNVPDNFWQRQLVQLRALAKLLPTTDIFHFYFGLTIVPKSIQFPILKAFRKKSVFHYLGSDIRGKTPEELAYGKRADAEIVGSYDAIRWVPEAHVVPNGLDLAKYEPVPPPNHRPVRVLHAPTSRQKKGTEWIVEACKSLPVELDIVENTRHDQAIERYKQADIVVDQLNAGWYGVFALECMALGKPVLTYLHDEAVRRTEEAFDVKLPLVPTTKETLADTLRPLIESAELREEIGRKSRAYVERVHDANLIADRLIEIYRSL
ncbi:MAG: glycosyltransferase family 4 protein [Actinobacteria bacterium]|nr:glycosyltransferase family 4 protein [Actinomycetota bacterium]